MLSFTFHCMQEINIALKFAVRGQRNKKIDIFGPNMIKHMAVIFQQCTCLLFFPSYKKYFKSPENCRCFLPCAKIPQKTPKQNKQRKLTSTQTHTHKSLLAIAILCCHIMCLLVVLFTPVTVSSLIPENPFWPLALQEVCEFSASSQTCAESKHKVRNSWASICTSQIMNSSTRGKLLLWNPEASEEHSEEMFGTAEYGSVLAQRALKNPWVFWHYVHNPA